MVLAGAGIGLAARHRPARTRSTGRSSACYGEVTGITQTVRNYGSSLGLAVLGAILIDRDKVNVGGALTKDGVPRPIAHRIADSFNSASNSSAGGQPHRLVHDVQLAFAHSTQTVFYVMAAVMAATFLVAVRGLPRGRVETVEATTPVAAETSA